jgi:hypothetical protein
MAGRTHWVKPQANSWEDESMQTLLIPTAPRRRGCCWCSGVCALTTPMAMSSWCCGMPVTPSALGRPCPCGGRKAAHVFAFGVASARRCVRDGCSSDDMSRKVRGVDTMPCCIHCQVEVPCCQIYSLKLHLHMHTSRF